MKKSTKRTAAIIGIILLLSVYLITFVLAFLDFPGSDRLFRIGIGATILVPILVWFYIWIYGKLTHTKTIADIYTEDNADGQTADMASAMSKKQDHLK